jgi:hypothetical protein
MPLLASPIRGWSISHTANLCDLPQRGGWKPPPQPDIATYRRHNTNVNNSPEPVNDCHTIRTPRPWLGLCAVAITLLAHSMATAQATSVAGKHHPWNRFRPGAWAKVRKYTQEFDAEGNVRSTSTAETKTVLVDVGEDVCTIQLEVTIEVAGKRFTAQPRLVRLGLYGETNGDHAVVQRLRSETIDTGGTTVQCDVLETTIHSKEKQVVSTLWYCQTMPPFILKRVSKSTDGEGKLIHKATSEELIAADMPHRVLSETMSTAYFRTVETHAAGSTVTLEIRCMDVPGGVVAHSSKQLDEAGKVISRSTLELLEYGFEEKLQVVPRRPLLFRHSRTRR